jgi:hypothetical protein
MIGRFFLTLLLLSGYGITGAQQFGGFPPSTRWQQIDTDTARVIFAGKVSPQAQRIAAVIHRMMKEDRASLGGSVRKINILLHPNTTIANGYVALGPFRSEYYLIPSSNIFQFGATPWNEELAIHEYRHVQQYSNFNKGLSKAAAAVLGQNGQALFNALAIPDWFFEGDAVHSETALTVQGRGRAPYFFNGYKALWHDQRDYSWMKLRNGSLKDYVPDHYSLGYLLTNYGYLQYGPSFWGKVTDDASRFRSLFYPFQKAVKRASGKDFAIFRQDALNYYKHEISTRRDKRLKRETVTDYEFPVMIGQDSLLYTKTAYDKIPAFYLKDSRGEHRIRQRNITTEDWLSYRNGILAYTAFSVNPRWGLTDYSNIYLLDITTKKELKLTDKGRYFTPDISPDGGSLVAVAFTDSADAELHLLNKEGKLLRTIKPEKEGDLFVHPRFASNETVVVAVRHADATMSLQRISVGSAGTTEVLIPAMSSPIGYPSVAGNKVYFVSSASGNDDIFSLDLAGPFPVTKLTQHTAGVTGNYYPSVYGDSLYYSGFTSNGFRIGSVPLTVAKPLEVSLRLFQNRQLPFKVANDGSTTNLLASTGKGAYPEKKYKKSTGLFNFHSRQADFSDPEVTVSFFSDNILNTFSNELFYRYNQNETSHALGFTTFYGAPFPVLSAGFTYTADRTIKTTTRTYSLDQKEARIGYNIPLNFTSGKTFKSLNFGSNFVYSETTPGTESRSLIRGISTRYLSHALNWSQRLPRAVQHIFPRFSYNINLAHRHLLGDKGFQFLGGTTVSLPSLRNHSLVLAANWQETDTSNIVFTNRFANSRGYNDFFFSRMWRLTGNYHMPLVYPDWGFANIVYFLRVRSNFFYDYTRVYGRSKLNSREQRSVGGELYFDTRWWNSFPVSFGVRMSHLLDADFSGGRPAGSNFFEFILPVNLIPR